MHFGLRRIWPVVAGAVVFVACVGPTQGRDHDEARRAVEAGEIRPLAEILNSLGGKLPGEIVRMKLEHKNRRWFYEFRVIDGKGRLLEVYVDALSGEIERTKEK